MNGHIEYIHVNGYILRDRDQLPGRTSANFYCNEGHDRVGASRSTCQATATPGVGVWSSALPSCNKPPPPPPPGCFPSKSKVKLENGKSVTMSDLHIGDKVQTVSSSGATIYSEVRAFLKKQPSIVTKYRSITTLNGTITLTGNHLLYVQKSLKQKFHPIFADTLSVGDKVFVQKNNELNSMKVINVSSLTMEDAYAPLTREGNIFVDGILASCHTGSDHDLAHFTMTLMHRCSNVMEWIFGIDAGFPVFASTAREMALLLLPDEQKKDI